MADGNLAQLFQKNLPDFHWQRIETGQTGRGIPDLNYCFEGIEGWIELKQSTTNRVDLRSEQVGWLLRRARAGGRSFIAVRKKRPKSARLWALDEIQIFQGKRAKELLEEGLDAPIFRCYWGTNGPQKWDWPSIRAILLQK